MSLEIGDAYWDQDHKKKTEEGGGNRYNIETKGDKRGNGGMQSEGGYLTKDLRVDFREL